MPEVGTVVAIYAWARLRLEVRQYLCGRGLEGIRVAPFSDHRATLVRINGRLDAEDYTSSL